MRLDVYRLRHHDFNGGWSIDLSREVLERGNAVAVLPYDPDRDEVVLIEQFRIGAYTAIEASPWQIEIVAGMIEAHHLPEETAHRETEEETGLAIYELEPVHRYLSSPGCTSESIRMYCGRVDAAGAGGLSGIAHEGEYIRVFTVTAEEVFAMLDAGRIENGMTIIALQWLKLNRDRLQDAWLDD
jgi:ADP-ribose pyrophosphatase